ncbi:MAG: periplasmic heavy metal sensor [Marivita sp.]|uniref:periplasmic heavy metal sensor n=1 Tax=Marivita sp. TaxID=2003365 RepID=UPI003EF16047
MAEVTSSKTPLWLRLTVLASFAVNLLVLGGVVGFLTLGGPDRQADRNRADVGSFYTRALTEEDRRALRRDFMASLADSGRDRGAVIADVQASLDALRATPFDPAAFANAMADQSARRLQREEVGRRLLADRIAAMSDADRAAYADRIEKRLANFSERLRR